MDNRLGQKLQPELQIHSCSEALHTAQRSLRKATIPYHQHKTSTTKLPPLLKKTRKDEKPIDRFVGIQKYRLHTHTKRHQQRANTTIYPSMHESTPKRVICTSPSSHLISASDPSIHPFHSSIRKICQSRTPLSPKPKNKCELAPCVRCHP